MSENAFARIAKAMEPNASVAGVDREPKYVVLYNHLLREIEHANWRPGYRLPTEASLAKVLPVSLGTIQKALTMLADEGAVVRRRGQGTVVGGAALTDSRKIRNFRVLDDDKKTLLPLYSKVLSVKRSNLAGPWNELFPGETSFVCIRRLMNVNMEFQAYGEAYLPEPRFRGFLTIPVSRLSGLALTDTLAERFNARAVKVINRFACGELPSAVCRVIGVSARTVGIEWELLGWSFRDRPVFYQRFYLPPSRRKLELNPVRF